MNKGFIVLHRQIRNNPIWKNSQLIHLFLELLLLAAHEETKFIWNGKEEVLKRGQLITGRFALAENTGIKPSSIRNYLKILQNIGILDIKSNNKFSVITIVKYSQYQDSPSRKDSKQDNNLTTKGQPEDTYNNYNNENNYNNKRGELTPSQKNDQFFKDEVFRNKIAETIANKYNTDLSVISQEINKFVSYWTEPNKSGTKVRWQQQQTFDVQRRLITWFGNINKFKTNQQEKKGIRI